MSWYEAAAYAEFAGKSLPTSYHWTQASQSADFAPLITSGSNFRGDGTQPVGSESALSGLLATFEQFVRRPVGWVVVERVSAVQKYDDLAPTLANRNLVLTGRLLSTLDSPRDHLEIDVDLIVANLAT